MVDYPKYPPAGVLTDEFTLFLNRGGVPASATLVELAAYVGAEQLPRLGALTETAAAANFENAGGAVATYELLGEIPAGAVVVGTKVLVPEGFAGDTSAAMTIGDGPDVDRYNTATIDVFTTAATGVQSGVPSGSKLQVAAVQPVLTVTSATDADLVIAGGGIVTVSIYYIVTV